MTEQEFYDRTMVRLEGKDFQKMHNDYCDSPLDKDEYCKQWVCKQYSNACEKANNLLQDLKDINADIKAYLKDGSRQGELKGLQVVRHQTMVRLWEASRTVNKLRSIMTTIL